MWRPSTQVVVSVHPTRIPRSAGPRTRNPVEKTEEKGRIKAIPAATQAEVQTMQWTRGPRNGTGSSLARSGARSLDRLTSEASPYAAPVKRRISWKVGGRHHLGAGVTRAGGHPPLHSATGRTMCHFLRGRFMEPPRGVGGGVFRMPCHSITQMTRVL